MTAVTPGSAELLAGLIQDAINVLHHDTTDGSDVDKYERECLRKKFSARLAAKPADEGALYRGRIWMKEIALTWTDASCWMVCNKSDSGAIEFHEVVDSTALDKRVDRALSPPGSTP